jgi:NADPH-dependent F420 reductase
MGSSTVGIIGAGNMGRGLVARLASAGHVVSIFDHTPERAAEVAQQAAAGMQGSASAGSIEDALGCDIVIIALWYPATVDFATEHEDALSGKIVIDISNPLDSSFTRVSVASDTSGAELMAQAVPNSRVVKSFNTIPAPTLTAGSIDSIPLDTFVASDHLEAKAAVLALLEGTGLRGLDAGRLDNARTLERLTAFGIELGQTYGLGFDFGFKYLPTTDLSVKK